MRELKLEAATVNLDTGAYTHDGAAGQLSPIALRLLAHLAERPMQTLSRVALLSEVWGYTAAAQTRVVDTTIRRLRSQLELAPRSPRHLVTAHGVGYRFVPLDPQPVAEVPLVLGDCTVRVGRLEARWSDGRQVVLSAQEGALLRALWARSGQLVSRATLLREVWEDRSGRRSRAVDNAISRLRAKLEPDPAHPRYLKAVRGAGYQLIIPKPPPPLATEPLPPEVAPLLGREGALSALAAQLASPGLVTVVGPGGIGKTRLARAVLRQHGGATFCDLSEADDAGGLLRAVAAGVGLGELPPGADAQIEELGVQLAALGPALVVMDNAEQVAEAAAGVLARWLAVAPTLRVLVTSRLRLRLPAERVYPLDPLAPDAASALFLARYAASGGTVTDDDTDDIAALVERLDGIPLAIELAAGRGRMLRPAALLARLDRQLALLRGGPHPRHASLEAAIAWSWELLSAAQQRALIVCSSFVGAFSLEAAEALIGDDALALLEALLDHSLLQSTTPPELPGEVRFSMLESIRAFARAQLSGDAWSAIADQHAAYYAQRAAQLLEELLLQGTAEVHLRLRLERANFMAAVQHALGRAPEDAAWCACAVAQYLNAVGEHSLLRRWGAALLPRVSPRLAARVGRMLAVVDLGVGRTAQALEGLGAALQHAEAAGDVQIAAEILGTLGTARDLARDPEGAREAYLRGVAAAAACGAAGLQAMLLVYAGVVDAVLGDGARAAERYDEAIAVIGEEGFVREQGFVFSHLGVMAAERAHYGRSVHLLRRALPALEVLDARGDVLMTRIALALALRGDGQDDEAARIVEEVASFTGRGVHRMRAAFVFVLLGQFWMMVGDFGRAEPILRRCADIPGLVRFQALAWIAVCDAAAGRAEESRRALEGARQAVRFPYNAPAMQALLSAWCERLLDDSPEAAARARAAAEAAREARMPGGEARMAAVSYDYRQVLAALEAVA